MIAIAAAAALAAFAQPQQEEPAPPPEVQSALAAWGSCVEQGIESSDPAASPRAAATSVLSACQSLQDELLTAHGRWLESSDLGEREKSDARRAMNESLGGLHDQVARAIGEMRED